ncbi:uroporphyrinogen-III C-methyltransferase [Shewanella gaetbuli]
MENNKLDSADINVTSASDNQASKDTNPKVKAELSPQAKRPPRPSSRKRRKASSWWVRLSILISWIAAGSAIAACYWLYMQLNQQQSIQQSIQQSTTAKIASLEARNKALQQNISQAINEPIARIQKLEQQQKDDTKAYAELSELKQKHQQLQQRVNLVAQRNPNHWMAAEAEYLARMASRKLWLEQDPQTATKLLQAADSRIEAMKDPALNPLRKALAHDIVTTRALKTTDITGATYAIDAVIEQIAFLPLNQVNTEISHDDSVSQLSDSVDDWQSNLSKSVAEFLSGFITIRERTTDLEPLLPVEQQWYLIENVRHKLLQAQFALYNYDKKAYDNAISYAQRWTKQYFDTHHGQTQKVLSELDSLSKIDIEPLNTTQFKSTPLLQQLVNYGQMSQIEEPSL